MFTGLLNTEMDVRSRTIVPDTYSGQSVTLTMIYTARMCRVDTLTNEQREILSRSGIEATHKFFCEGDMTIVPENEIVCADKVYRVVSVLDPGAMTNETHHLTVLTRTPS